MFLAFAMAWAEGVEDKHRLRELEARKLYLTKIRSIYLNHIAEETRKSKAAIDRLIRLRDDTTKEWTAEDSQDIYNTLDRNERLF